MATRDGRTNLAPLLCAEDWQTTSRSSERLREIAERHDIVWAGFVGGRGPMQIANLVHRRGPCPPFNSLHLKSPPRAPPPVRGRGWHRSYSRSQGQKKAERARGPCRFQMAETTCQPQFEAPHHLEWLIRRLSASSIWARICFFGERPVRSWRRAAADCQDQAAGPGTGSCC